MRREAIQDVVCGHHLHDRPVITKQLPVILVQGTIQMGMYAPPPQRGSKLIAESAKKKKLPIWHMINPHSTKIVINLLCLGDYSNHVYYTLDQTIILHAY